jgi:hypothetical protein
LIDPTIALLSDGKPTKRSLLLEYIYRRENIPPTIITIKLPIAILLAAPIIFMVYRVKKKNSSDSSDKKIF